MTCREKLAIEHPEDICEDYNGSCAKCPHDYGYLDKPISCGFPTPILKQIRCDDCWDREIPENTETKIEDENMSWTIEHETKKENNSMSNSKKTKAMLQEEIEQLRQELSDKNKELAKLDKYKKFDDMGEELFVAMTAMINAGFTHDEAFTLLQTVVANATRC